MSTQQISILIAALGGEGGGVLTDWLAEAARSAGYRVQCTSIPGVAQRTGATTYYIELADSKSTNPLALTPMPGMVDLMVASELMESARALQNGYITPNKTTLITSSHRVYATSEKSVMGDGRFDLKRLREAVLKMSHKAVLFDMDKLVQESKSGISSIMLGAVAACGVLKINRETYEEIIKASGIAVTANLKGFALGYTFTNQINSTEHPESKAQQSNLKNSKNLQELKTLVETTYPEQANYFVKQGLIRLYDYQDLNYAKLYLERLKPILDLDEKVGGVPQGYKLLCETARHLALRMSFEDLARVADLKSRRERFTKIRKDLDVQDDEPLVVTEYLKPGLEEFCGFMPTRIAKPILRWAEKNDKLHSYNIGIYLKTSRLGGFFLLWLVAKMRLLRMWGYRFYMEDENIKRWLHLIDACAQISYSFGVQVVVCASIIKGYSGTYRKGLKDFNRIIQEIIEPAIAKQEDASEEVANAIKVALTHSGSTIVPKEAEFKPIKFVRNDKLSTRDESIQIS
jgi:indolepyruvate ferredoxin oxidoreductase, beta subunit